jgi:hypothetical protein
MFAYKLFATIITMLATMHIVLRLCWFYFYSVHLKQLTMKRKLQFLLLAIVAMLLLSFTKAFVKHNLSSSKTPENGSVASFINRSTTATLLQLIEQGKIKADDSVFGAGAILGSSFGTRPYDESVLQLTVRDLLQATVNFKDENLRETTFTNTNMSARELIDWSLDNLLLNKEPGTNAALVDFSFCVQGQLIEKITGTDYSTPISTY